MIGTCHLEKKNWAINPCHYLKNGTHNFVSLTRKVQGYKIKRHTLVCKVARLLQANTYNESNLFLPPNLSHNSVFSRKGYP